MTHPENIEDDIEKAQVEMFEHTPQTTPDTEWEKETEDTLHRVIIGVGIGETDYNQAMKELKSLLTSRDTYWKERVRKDVERIKKLYDRDKAIDTLLDNLK